MAPPFPDLAAGNAAAAMHVCRTLIDALAQAVWLVDARSRVIVAVNGAAERLLGSSASEIVGHPPTDFAAAPEDAVYWQEAAGGMAETLESDTWVCGHGAAARPVTRRVSRLSVALPVSAGPMAVPAIAGPPLELYLVVLEDRSEDRRLRAEREATTGELQATLESVSDGILVTDMAGRIRNFNRRFADLWELPPELLVQRDDDAVLDWMRRSVADPGAYMRRLAAMEQDARGRLLDVVRLRSGRVLESASLPQLARGQPIGRVASYREVRGSAEALPDRRPPT